jgi:hypothetical protein
MKEVKMATYRIIQWATGAVGQSAIKAIVGRDDMALTACYVSTPEKAGIDAGVLAGLDPIGIAATTDRDAILASDADCVVYVPLVHNTEDILALLRSGKDVVTACPYQFLADGSERAAIDEACRAGGASLLGGGVAPGQFTIILPMLMTTLSSEIRHIHVRETGKPSEYPSPLLIGERMKFGRNVEEAEGNTALSEWILPWYAQSLRLICSRLGFAIDPVIRSRHLVWPSLADFDSPLGFIAQGTAGTQLLEVEAVAGGTPVFTYTKFWPSGAPTACEFAWTRGWEVEIQGEPSLSWSCRGFEAEYPGQKDPPVVRATANCLVNAIPQLHAAEPGFVTLADLPPMTARAAAMLR